MTQPKPTQYPSADFLDQIGMDSTARTDGPITWEDAANYLAGQFGPAMASRIMAAAQEDRCPLHPAYEPDYCPVCGTARKIGQ